MKKGSHHTIESNLKNRLAHLGKKLTEKQLFDLSLGRGWNKGLKRWWKSPSFKKGQISPRKGVMLSKETIQKIKESLKGRVAWNKNKPYLQIRGEKNPAWKGGITPEIIKIRQSFEMDKWAREGKIRDDYRCRDCGEKGGKLESDHIYQFSKYPKLRFEPLNHQTLCKSCHKQKTIFERIGRMKLNSLINF